jgi:DNA-binding transcriptional regulator YdaS (Cro superfamily)
MTLREYLDQLPGGAQEFAKRLGISRIFVLQLAAKQNGRQPKPELCVRIERASKGAVSRMVLRDDAAAIWPELAKPGKKVAQLTQQPAAKAALDEDLSRSIDNSSKG